MVELPLKNEETFTMRQVTLLDPRRGRRARQSRCTC
jgi:hypothetical protein